jgi:hypothetical protein
MATAVDNASAAVVTSSTQATCLRAQAGRASGARASRAGKFMGISISGESVSNLSRRSRRMPAPIRPDLGEGFDEQGRFCVLG